MKTRDLGSLVVVLALVLIASTMSAAGAAGVTAGVEAPFMLRVGQTFTATAWIETDGIAVGSFSGSLAYDPAILQYNSYNTNLPAAGWMAVINDTQTGRVIFVGANINGQVGRIVPVTVSFTAVKRGRPVLDLTYTAISEARTFAKLVPSVRDFRLWVR